MTNIPMCESFLWFKETNFYVMFIESLFSNAEFRLNKDFCVFICKGSKLSVLLCCSIGRAIENTCYTKLIYKLVQHILVFPKSGDFFKIKILPKLSG